MAITKNNPKYNKHMTQNDREEIQSCLDHGMNFKAIAARIGKDSTTVSKEIKKHLKVSPTTMDPVKAGTAVPCPLLLKAPFVCNGCKKRHYNCGFRKHLYLAKISQDEYKQLLTEAREGIPLNKESFYEIDKVITDGIKKGQHLYHIIEANSLEVSKSTVYRHMNKGYYSVAPIDLPRAVKFKPRRKHTEKYVPKALKKDRTYDDFCHYIEKNNIHSWVELDTVIGRPGGKVIMTFAFTFCNFMFGLLMDDKSKFAVAEQFELLKTRFKEKGINFEDVFPLILTDNGGEFSNVYATENNLEDTPAAKLFFCDPYQSSQKPHVEKNHTLFRDIVPKGESFDNFTQETVNLIFSHVNSVKRKSLNGKTSFEMFSFTYGSDIAALPGISEIPLLGCQ